MTEFREFVFLLAVKKIAKRYRQKKYARILKFIKYLRTNKSVSTVYRNLFRALSLHKTNHPDWKQELGYIINEQLDLLGLQNKIYIVLFIENEIEGNLDGISGYPQLVLSQVSELTKEIFPANYSRPPFSKTNFREI